MTECISTNTGVTFIGGSDDSLNLVAFLGGPEERGNPLSEIFAKIGLDKQNGDFRQTVEYLEFTHSDGVEMDFHFAIDVVTDLAAILLECSVSGSVNLHDLDEYNTPPAVSASPPRQRNTRPWTSPWRTLPRTRWNTTSAR